MIDHTRAFHIHKLDKLSIPSLKVSSYCVEKFSDYNLKLTFS